MGERKLTDACWNRFCEFLAECGNKKTMEALEGHWTGERARAAWREDLYNAINDGYDRINFELGPQYTKNQNPIDFSMDSDDWTEIETPVMLMDYATGEVIREATKTEILMSLEAAEYDNGVGAFRATVDGREITVYVEAL